MTRSAADWKHLADDYDRRADSKRGETDQIEAEIAATLQNAGIGRDHPDYLRLLALVSQHGLVARDWGANRAHADDLAVRSLEARANESSQAHIDRHLHITKAA